MLLQKQRGEQPNWSCSNYCHLGLQHHRQVYTFQIQSQMDDDDDWMFEQEEVPQINEIMVLQQPQEELLSEHWRSLITALQVKKDEEEEGYVYLIYKNKSSVSFINFKAGIFLYQKTFKINYGQVHEMTCLKLQTITIRVNDKPRKEQILVVGFMDGSIEVYSLSVDEKVVSLQRILSFQFWEKKEPVTTIGFRQRNMYVSRTHSVWVYRDCLSLIANIIVDQIAPASPSRRPARTYDIKNLASPIKIGSMAKGTVLHSSLGSQAIHIYNQSDGAKSYHCQSLDEKGTIIDSIVLMQEVSESNLIVADTNDKLKVIYKAKSFVQRYTGFKNYPVASQHLLFPSVQQLWIGDLYGCITLITRPMPRGSPAPASTRKLKMVDIPLTNQKRICKNGIKALRICDQLMFVQDTEGSIIVYDVVRKVKEWGGDVESMSAQSGM